MKCIGPSLALPRKLGSRSLRMTFGSCCRWLLRAQHRVDLETPLNSDHGAKWAGVPRLGRTPSFGMTVPVGIWGYIPLKGEIARTQLQDDLSDPFVKLVIEKWHWL